MTPLSQFEAHWPEISALLDEALNLPSASGRTDEAAGIARALLAELATQHPQSPRLALARQLAVSGS